MPLRAKSASNDHRGRFLRKSRNTLLACCENEDPEIAEWLKTGLVLGAHKPIHEQRRECDAFIDANLPPIGRIETKMPFDTPAGVENRTGGYVDTAGVLLFVWSLLPQGVDYSQPYVTPLNAPSHADLPPALLVSCGFDMLRDVGHAYAKKLAADGNTLTYVHHPDLPHGFIQMTTHSARCLQATEELAGLLGDALGKR